MSKFGKICLLPVLLGGIAFGANADAQKLTLGCSQIAMGEKLHSDAATKWSVNLPANDYPSFAPDAFRVTLDLKMSSASATGMPFLTPETALRLQVIPNGFVIHTEPHSNAAQTDSTITFTENRTTGTYVLRQDVFAIKGGQRVANSSNWWVGTCTTIR
jgi:hypothetical protein